ncbi:MAG: sugar phosphate isomerase/epimerase [Candidatus Methanomethylophilaceae archaeon]
MRHLLSHSVYQDLSIFGDDPSAKLTSIGCDGVELLTGFGPVDPVYRDVTRTVHLPYATDWISAWEGHPYDMDEETSRYVMYGRSRDDIVSNLASAIGYASVLDPSHGVIHVTNVTLDEVCRRKHTSDPGKVIDTFCEMINSVVGPMPGGEPPFRLAFENLWWPGLRLLDMSDYRRLERGIEFEDWGICLDTGHMMNCLPDIDTESKGIEAVIRVIEGYSDDLIDRIGAVHFHWSASWRYRSTFEERGLEGDPKEFYFSAYPHVSMIDQHMPFSDPGCNDILDILRPDTVIHEMPGSDVGVIEDFIRQRSLIR